MFTLSLLPLVLMASTATNVSAEPVLPQGIFRTACIEIGKDGRHGLIAEVSIEGNVISASAQSYARNDCDEATVRADYRGVVTGSSESGDRIDFTQQTGAFTYTLLADDVTTYYNANVETAGCGIGDWQTGVARDVAGATCAPYSFPDVGTVLKDSVWANNNGIVFGRMPLVWETDDTYPATASGILFTRVKD
ncbi:hypothetical protein [Martelella limonii]|uniref:hypothetical protein n=1 Tax=Martelella limonii TaxID=1647649 RepID=UPI001580918E|nr:hypothetical protein [Martelella limonii]